MKKLTLSIAIPAFNEERNIKNILSDCLKQKRANFDLLEILVLSDGSPDKTFQNAKSIKSKFIKVLENKKNIGNSKTIEKLLKNSNGEVVVLLDGDVRLSSIHSIEKLINPFLNNERVALVSGVAQPVNNRTLIQKAVHSSFNAFIKMKKEIKNGNNVYSCLGTNLAISKKLYSKIKFPKRIVASDSFIYFLCLKNGFEFKFVNSNIVNYKLPETLKDHLSQNKRFLNTNTVLKKYFGKKVEEEFFIPKSIVFKHLFLAFLKQPFTSFLIFLINLYIRIDLVINPNKIVKWSQAISTK